MHWRKLRLGIFAGSAFEWKCKITQWHVETTQETKHSTLATIPMVFALFDKIRFRNISGNELMALRGGWKPPISIPWQEPNSFHIFCQRATHKKRRLVYYSRRPRTQKYEKFLVPHRMTFTVMVVHSSYMQYHHFCYWDKYTNLFWYMSYYMRLHMNCSITSTDKNMCCSWLKAIQNTYRRLTEFGHG